MLTFVLNCFMNFYDEMQCFECKSYDLLAIKKVLAAYFKRKNKFHFTNNASIKKTVMQTLAYPSIATCTTPVSACRYCRNYELTGRRGGTCQVLNVSVQGEWKGCHLSAPQFEPLGKVLS